MIYVFEVHIKPGHTAEQYADAWVRASKIIQRAPGARGTRLHRKLTDPTVMLAIASWGSKSQRDTMEASPSDAVKAIIDHFRFVGHAFRFDIELNQAGFLALCGTFAS